MLAAEMRTIEFRDPIGVAISDWDTVRDTVKTYRAAATEADDDPTTQLPMLAQLHS